LKNLPQVKLSLPRKPKEDFSSDTLSFSESSATLGSKEKYIYKLISIVISSIFIVLFFISVFLNIRLSSLKSNIDAQVLKVDAYAQVEASYGSIAKSLNTYKSVRDTKTSIYNKTLVVYEDIPNGIVINSLNITDVDFHISLSSTDLLLFSKLIAQYLRSPLVSSITLESANLSSITQGYLVSIKGTFK